MHATLARVRELVGGPMGIVLYNFRYMPTAGRSIGPPVFKDQMKSAASRLNLPGYDPAALVREHGADTAIIENSAHYKPAFHDTVAEALREFISRL